MSLSGHNLTLTLLAARAARPLQQEIWREFRCCRKAIPVEDGDIRSRSDDQAKLPQMTKRSIYVNARQPYDLAYLLLREVEPIRGASARTCRFAP
jgi:hypothetical protein